MALAASLTLRCTSPQGRGHTSQRWGSVKGGGGGRAGGSQPPHAQARCRGVVRLIKGSSSQWWCMARRAWYMAVTSGAHLHTQVLWA